MILRGRTPRALTLTGLAAVLILGLVLLPLVPTWAQDPPPAAAGQKEDKGAKVADKDAEKDADKARREYQKLQDDYIKLQRQMEDKRRELEAKLQDEFSKAQQDLMKRMREVAQKAGIAAGPGVGLVGGPPPALLINPGNPGLVPPLQPGAFPQPNFQPPAALPFIGGPARPDLERRLDALEQKLDKLLQRLDGGKTAPPNRTPGTQPGTPREGADREAPPAARIPGAPLAPPAAPPEEKR